MSFLEVKETFVFDGKNDKTITGSPVPTVRIIEDTESNMMCVTIGGHEYSFNADWIPEEHKRWLAWITASHLQECHDRAALKTADEFKNAMIKFFSIFGVNLR